MPSTKSSGRLFTIGLVTSWYSTNIAILLLNKYLLSNYGFSYPIFLTMCHMAACSLLSYVAIAWMKMVPMQTIQSCSQFLKISALSLVSCASVVSGNISLRYLPVSFNQAIGATTPFFTAVFAFVVTSERESWLTYATLVPVITGVIIASELPLLKLLEGERNCVMVEAGGIMLLSITWNGSYLFGNGGNRVLGNAKGAVAVVVSILIFRNPVSVTGMLGYMLTVVGVILYSTAKPKRLQIPSVFVSFIRAGEQSSWSQV
ncbi:hypothetical protein U1Q18_022278 [Sarracenia purpurea var. burkii]